MCFLFGGILPMGNFILYLDKGTRIFSLCLTWPFRIIPAYSFGYGLMSITKLYFYLKLDCFNHNILNSK